jgi:myo-inositol 2-dehydrogenase/D-chiro-inositol 1-dehydrogenase
MKREPYLPQTITRRDFLKTSTVAASAAAIGTLDLSRTAHAAGSDIIKVGMIGCGGRNAGAAGQALSADPGARLVAMCDIFRDRIEAKLESLKAVKGAQVTVDEVAEAVCRGAAEMVAVG